MAENKLSIYPYAYGLFGTQQYYNEFYTYKSAIQRKKQGQGGVTPPPVIAYSTVEEATKFKFLSIDLGLSLKYRFNSFSIHFTPAYTIPFSPATFISQTEFSKENLKNSFYYNMGINFLL